MSPYGLSTPAEDTYGGLRALYVKGDIECDEFESRLDVLLAREPEALDAKPFHLTDEPGQIIYYQPPSTANVHAILREVYAPQIAFSDRDEGDNGGLPYS